MNTPSAIEIENEILGCLLVDSNDECLEIIEKLEQDDFFLRSNRIVFSKIKELHGIGKPFDVVSLTTHLKDGGILDDVGGHYGISRFASYHTSNFKAIEGMEVLKEKTRLRRLIELSEEIKQECEDSESAIEIIDRAESKIKDIHGDVKGEDLLQSGCDRVQSIIKARLSGEVVYGIRTGIKSFDDVFHGIQESQYYAICGSPSSGKTAFVDQCCCNFIKNDIPAVYIPLESSEDRVIGKIACKMAQISYSRFMKCKCNESELRAISLMTNKIRGSKISFKRPKKLTSDSLRSTIMRELRKNDVKIFIVDYIQKIVGDDKDPRIGIMQASMKLQSICVETKATGLIICQLNRESKKESRPQMHHIKESGQIEQDADNICLFWSEKQNHELEPNELRPSIITIEKNKDGISGIDQKLFFDGEMMTFKERSKYEK